MPALDRNGLPHPVSTPTRAPSSSSRSLWLLGSAFVACGGCASTEATEGGTAGEGSGGAAGTEETAVIGDGLDPARFNQCGVAAPLPVDTGDCVVPGEPELCNFDDFSGESAASYAFSIGEGPVQGRFQHIGDGSEVDGSVISMEMVTGLGDTGYALRFANTNATNWGGLLMITFTGSSAPLTCLDAHMSQGVAFSIRGTSPSGRFGVNLGMLDTAPTSEQGLCNNASSDDCKGAAIELNLPSDPQTWERFEIPWSAFTPGLGSDQACVPVTGQNLFRLVIQPFMNYPPPNYAFEPGPYLVEVDELELI